MLFFEYYIFVIVDLSGPKFILFYLFTVLNKSCQNMSCYIIGNANRVTQFVPYNKFIIMFVFIEMAILINLFIFCNPILEPKLVDFHFKKSQNIELDMS